jgi:hypothetical protein
MDVSLGFVEKWQLILCLSWPNVHLFFLIHKHFFVSSPSKSLIITYHNKTLLCQALDLL